MPEPDLKLDLLFCRKVPWQEDMLQRYSMYQKQQEPSLQRCHEYQKEQMQQTIMIGEVEDARGKQQNPLENPVLLEDLLPAHCIWIHLH